MDPIRPDRTSCFPFPTPTQFFKRPLPPPNEYTTEKETAAIQEARSSGLSEQQVEDLRKKFGDGRRVHEMVCALFVHFSRFRKHNSKVFRDIIVLFEKKDSEILTKLFDKIIGMPIFKKALSAIKSDQTLLHLAAFYGHDEVIKKMVEAGFNPDFKTKSRHTGAFTFNRFSSELVTYKIEAGKNYLEYARSSNESYVRLWLHIYPESTFPYLIHAQRRNFPLVDHRLMGAIADVNQPNDRGEMLLHLALTKHFSISVILALLEKGANPLISNTDGQTALAQAILRSDYPGRCRDKSVLALFLDAACALDPKNFDTYEKHRQQKISGHSSFYLILKQGITDDGLGAEFQICKSLKEPYNLLRFAFERTDPLKKDWFGGSAYDLAKHRLTDYELDKDRNKNEIDSLKTFVLPLFKERIAIAKQTLAEPLESLPLVLIPLIASYLTRD